MKRNKHFYSLFLVLALISGCNYKSIYEKSFNIDKGEWNKSQVVKFEVPVTDTINGYDIFIELRNNDEYPYSNLFLFVTTKSPNGASKKDTLQMTLADEKGKWLGKGLGGIRSNEKMFSNIRFPVSGNYKIEIVHGMRDDVLKGIMDVGLDIEKAR
jgi:gliding motility-associated lipoprotein GldH